MRLAIEHPWNLSPGEAIALQRELAERVETGDRLPDALRTVAGVDVGFEDAGGAWVGVGVELLGFAIAHPSLRRCSAGFQPAS